MLVLQEQILQILKRQYISILYFILFVEFFKKIIYMCVWERIM